MPQLSIKLLGGLSISLDAQPLTSLVSQKAEILLAYLCMERREHSREILATLLWENSSQEQGLANLRTLLASLKKHLDPFLLISRQTVGIHPEADLRVDAFDLRDGLQRLLPEPARHFDELQAALALYQGEFMQGVYPRDSRMLEEWIELTREQLLQLALTGHHTLGTYCLDSGLYSRGLPHAQALLRLDPGNETHHRLMMNLLARNGQREAALAQYEACTRILAEQFGLTPEPETTALAERLRQAPVASLPTPGTSFVGRQAELAKIAESLRQPECRLLTILGLGGSGKTRLALQAAHLMQNEFSGGAVFVPLHGIEHANYLAASIAEAMQLSLRADLPSHEQLARFLQKKETLILLDNCEHLLEGESAALFRQVLTALLKGAPRLRFLLTSRARIGLSGEWLFELQGLGLSFDALAPACDLFLQRARAVAPALLIDDSSRAAIFRICQIVHGLPLGIELAAAWARSLPCTQIAAILEQNLDLLSSRLPDVPERQRSLRAVFDYVWERLDDPARTLAARLGVFASSFDLEAAQGVTQATPWLVADLVEKSFLHLENGRYRMIEALQTYALEKLAQTPELEVQTQTAHTRHYLGLLHRMRYSLQVLRFDLENLRAAWLRAVQLGLYPSLEQSADDLCRMYIQRGMFQEARQLFEMARDSLPDAPPTQRARVRILASLASFLNYLSSYEQSLAAATDAIERARSTGDWYGLIQAQIQQAKSLWRQDQYDPALETLQQAIHLARHEHFDDLLAAALREQSVLDIRRSNYREARDHCMQALQRYRQLGDRQGEGSIYNNLGVVEWYEGNLLAARAYFEQDLEICRALGDSQGETQTLGNLGYIAVALGQTTEAEKLYKGMLERHQQSGDRQNEAWALNSLAELALQQGRYYAMKVFCEQGLLIGREINSRWVEGNLLITLGLAYETMGAYEQAAEHMQIGVDIKRELGETYPACIGMAYLGRVWARLGEFERADACAHEAIMLSKESDDEQLAAEARLVAAHLLFVNQDYEEARQQVQAALVHWQDSDHTIQVIDAQVLLAEIALALGEPTRALTHVNLVFTCLEHHPVTDTTNTTHLYLVCLQTLAANQDARTMALAAEARAFVEARQREITDPVLRSLYLSRLAEPLLVCVDSLPG